MRTLVILALALALLIAALPAGASSPQANTARKCGLSSKQQRSLGTTYVLTLRVSGTKCANGRKVVKAFQECRRKRGRAGRCTRRVFGYRCEERRYNKIPTQYDSRVRCKKSGREIFHIYTQNT